MVDKVYFDESLYYLRDKLFKITQTYDYHSGNEIETDDLHFENNLNGAYKKSCARISNIIQHINNKKEGITKKYQVKGFYEYKIIHNYCVYKNIKHELVFDENVSTNKAINIKQYITDYDDENNLQKLIFEYKKIPAMYIRI
jgi:hypothetical protein